MCLLEKCLNCELSDHEKCRPIGEKNCKRFYCKFNAGIETTIDGQKIVTKFGIHGK